jgi:hypothetical protein
MHTVRPGVWREIRKLWKMRNTHCMTWNVARTSEKQKREIQSVGPVLLRENVRSCKMRHKHCMTWNTVRNSQKREK